MMKRSTQFFLRINLALLLVALFVNCKNDSTEFSAPIAKETIISGHEVVLQKVISEDSIFNVKGKPFIVNSLKCYWEYDVQIDVKNSNERNAIIKFQSLKNATDHRTIFETANEIDNSNAANLYHSIKDIQNYGAYNIECEDVNADGFCDYKIVIERAAAGANMTYDVFLFNPKNKQFELSRVFSGTNIEYDSEKNRIFSMWKMGARTYNFGYINLKKNKLDIESAENISQDQDTVFYTKTVKGKVISQKKMILKRTEEEGNEIHADDTHYLLERK